MQQGFLRAYAMNVNPSPKIAILLNYFPVLSETFIYSEIKGLKNLGIKISIFSLFRTDNDKIRNDAKDLLSLTTYLSDDFHIGTLLSAHLFFLLRRPRHYFKTFFFALEHRNTRSILRTVILLWRMRGKSRLSVPKHDRQNILLHFFLVAPFAKRIHKGRYLLIHAHLVNAATSFAMLGSMLTKASYCVTTHATDLFVQPEMLRQKFKTASFIITCTKYNKEYIRERYPVVNLDNVYVIYHGLNVDLFRADLSKRERKGPALLSIGRLVEKKGFHNLLHACRIINDRNIPFTLTIVGEGPERAQLELYVRVSQLTDRVIFAGAVPPDQIRSFYEKANLFVLPCIIASSGDRDGIPNVIAEAMAMELPVVSTSISGIPEVVASGKTGLLVEPNDVDALVDAILDLVQNPEKAVQMGRSGRERIIQIFDAKVKIKELYDLLIEKLY